MAIFRCKMCGGNLEVLDGTSFGICEFCETKQTLPTVSDEGLQTLFNRANVLRMKSEFDKAADIYEKIIQKSENQAEAYWGLILCKYGIEYVEDPATFKRVPTCHRASFDAVISDEDYKNALKYADEVQRVIYENEAKMIDEIQKGIISLAQKNNPYDVFICYKETDENGKRTQDSVIANDIYHQLTMEGFKVFYAAITLEDKLGTEYEPYIFSALNTAKVMLAIGTKPEYFNAVWVKNEWARFLKIMKKDRNKLLIPCYRDMDPYELPEEFAHLQAQDMSKIGFINDLVRGINKIITNDSNTKNTQENVITQQNISNTTTSAQVKRGNMALEDAEWEKADAFFEEALNINPECAEAYIGKLLAKEQQPNWEALIKMYKNQYKEAKAEYLEACPVDTEHIDNIIRNYIVKRYLDEKDIRKLYDFDRSYTSAVTSRKNQKEKLIQEIKSERLLIRAKQYATNELEKQIEDGIARVKASLDQRIANAEEKAKDSKANVKKAYSAHIIEADKKVQELYAKAIGRYEWEYQRVVGLVGNVSSSSEYENIIDSLKKLDGYKDTNELIEKCQQKLIHLQEEKRREEEIRTEHLRKEIEKKEKQRKIIAIIVGILIVLAIIVKIIIIPIIQYNNAVKQMKSENVVDAYEAFISLDGYKDSAEKANSIYEKYKVEKLKLSNVNVGDYIFYGAVDQDYNEANGAEDIEWIVLDVKYDRALVISKYCLTIKEFDWSKESVVWADCSLCEWLNDNFINDSFSESERARIATGGVQGAHGRIYLLSVNEAEQYFEHKDLYKVRFGIPTVSAFKWHKGAKATYEGENFRWWLRSSGYDSEYATCVQSDGEIDSFGEKIDDRYAGVRPVMWINLD